MPTSINKPIAQAMEKQQKVLMPRTPKVQNNIVLIPNYANPYIYSKDDSMVERNTIQDISREIPIYSDPVHRPPPKQVKTPLHKIPRSLFDIDPELNMDFEENCPFQEDVISAMYQRLEKSFFPRTTRIGKSNIGRLVQKVLPKQADIDKIIKDYTKEGSQRNAFTCNRNTGRIFNQPIF